MGVAMSFSHNLVRYRLFCGKVAALFLIFSSTAVSFAQVPRFSHVAIVVEENHDYKVVIDNPVMPYLSSLVQQYGVATNYYGNSHPSIGNYFMLTTGELITANDDFISQVTVDNIVRHLMSAGKTWKSYADGLPSVGYIGGDVYPYQKHHNPFAYFSDVIDNPLQLENLVPISQLATDLAAGSLPDYSFITPSLQNDGHDCPPGMLTCTVNDKLVNADKWLQVNIDPLIKNPLFQDGLLIIVFDEADDTDVTNGGGHVAAVIVSPLVKWVGYRARAVYQHQSALRLMASGLGLTSFPGQATNAPDMAQFFGHSTWPCPAQNTLTFAVSLCTPSDGSTLTSPFQLFAVTIADAPITSLQFMVDGAAFSEISAGVINTLVQLPIGSHLLTVQATNANGQQAASSAWVNIVPK
jgi:phosphatidylinositol-3-phosphatase